MRPSILEDMCLAQFAKRYVHANVAGKEETQI